MKTGMILLLLGGVGAAAPPENQPLQRLAVTHVTVIDAVSDVSKPDITILMEGNRIAAIMLAGQFSLAAATRVIDGTGKFVIPGLTDMHNHGADGTLNPFAKPEVLRQALACGVTTIFCPGASSRDFIAFKRATADPNAPLSRYYSAGKVFSVRGGHDPSRGQASFYPVTPEEARANVREQKAAGVDAIKFILPHVGIKPVQRLKHT